MPDIGLIDGGEIVNTHGVRGAVKIKPWTNTPEVLRVLPRLFIGDIEYKMLSASVLNGNVIATLDGVDTFDLAAALRGSVVRFAKSDAVLGAGEVFVADVLGLDAVDDETGGKFGVIADFFSLPSNDVYTVKSDGREILIPAVPEFVREINVAGGFVKFCVIEGL
jgi:16S rRNA processing protein RimM